MTTVDQGRKATPR